MAFCALKSPDELEYNVRQMIGSRHHRNRELGKEVGSVEWSHGASDPDTGKATFLAWKVKEMQTILQEVEQRVKGFSRQAQRFANYKLTAPTDLTQQTLRTMRPKHSMRDNLVECCKFGLPVVQGNATFQVWMEERQHYTRRLMRAGFDPRIAYPVVEGHQLPQTEVSLMELEAASRRPDPITKLSPKMVKLLQTYGVLKVEEWKQRAKSRGTSQPAPEQAVETATTADAEPEPGEPIQESTPLLPRRLMTCLMQWRSQEK